MDVAAGRAAAGGVRLVELVHQRAHLGHAGRVGGAQDQGVAARLGQQRGLERGVGLALGCGRGGRAATVDEPRHQRGQVGSHGIFERDDLDIAGIGDIHRRHDARQALQVVGIVGDHQRVVAGVHVDGVVGADQRAKHWHQVGSVFVVEFEDLRDDLPAAGACGAALRHAHAAALQLGVGLGHHLVQAGRLDHREALQPQRGQKLLEGGRRRHGPLGDQGELALDARVHHHVAAGDGGHGAGHGLDLGVGEVQRDGLARVHAAGAGSDGRLRMNLTVSACQ